jgi:hypothetical protein
LRASWAPVLREIAGEHAGRVKVTGLQHGDQRIGRAAGNLLPAGIGLVEHVRFTREGRWRVRH